VVAAAGSLLIFFLSGKSLAMKLKFALIALAAIVALAWASYRIDVVRIRWERTFYDQSFAGRERIFPEAMAMILEKPLIGWGPINHYYELGSRLGLETRDEHNLYLWLLAEVGLFGAIPFLIGLWLCWRAAWGARSGIQGVLPVVMLLFLLVSGLKGTAHKGKLFWVVLSFAMASASYGTGRRPSMTAVLSSSSRVRLRQAYRSRNSRLPKALRAGRVPTSPHRT
jgi:hypothetical protein